MINSSRKYQLRSYSFSYEICFVLSFLRRIPLPRLLNSIGILDESFIAYHFLLKEFHINQNNKVIHNLEFYTSEAITVVRILHTALSELLKFSRIIGV